MRPSSLHGLVRTLAELNWVEAGPVTSAFGIGRHALRTGAVMCW
ncbi:hypothetical protein ACGF0J_12825 [Nonomuraea sp. NPDC047897]